MMPDHLPPQRHDNLFRSVFGEPVEAAGLLQAHLPRAVADRLQWSTLSVEDSDFIGPDLRASESDLLYAIRRRADGARAWVYVLLEHQSTAGRRDRWMRLRLLQYCCRIWERDRRDHPEETELRPIVPIVFYVGDGRWRHATEFSELFPEEMRRWPWLPRFEHVLIDHSDTPPEAVRGAPKGRAAQLIMMAGYRVATARWPALRRALPLLANLAVRNGWQQVANLLVYVMVTQQKLIRDRFMQEFRRLAPKPGGEVMNYVEELKKQGLEEGREEGLEKGLEEGLEKGREETLLKTTQGLLRQDVPWSVIEKATGVDEARFRRLEQQFNGSG